MNNKKIMSTTLMFIIVVVSVILFKNVFGDKNTLVGVAGITAALSLLGTDYSLNPIKNTIYFIILEIILGIAAYLTSLNAWLALIVTFAVIFYILYSFTYNTKKPTYVAFTLGYTFMVYTPVTIEELPLRLIGLMFCGVAIMVLQIILNNNRLKKQAIAQLNVSLKSIIEEVSLMFSNGDYKDIKNQNNIAHNTLKSLIETLYEVIDEDKIKLPMPLLQYFFIGQFLDSLNIQLSKYKNFKNMQISKYLLSLLNDIEKFVNNEEDVNFLLCSLEKYIDSTKIHNSKNYLEFKLNTYASMLKRELLDTESQDINQIIDNYFTPKLISKLNSFKNNLNRGSLKFTFAFRGALTISLGVFIVSIFNIPNGKWLVFSLLSIVQPYLESSNAKAHQRVLGTIVGLIIFELVFSIVTDTAARTLIILLVGYLSNYQTNYREQMVCTTISALGAASIGANIIALGFDRLILVLIGSLVALLANKLILPYKVGYATKSIIKQSVDINKKIISTLFKKGLWSNQSTYDLRALISINKLLSQLISSNNNMLLSKEVDDYIYNQHVLMNDIRILKVLFADYERTNYKKFQLVYDIDYLIKKDLARIEIISFIEKIDDVSVQLILVNLLSIKEHLSNSQNLSMIAIKSI